MLKHLLERGHLARRLYQSFAGKMPAFHRSFRHSLRFISPIASVSLLGAAIVLAADLEPLEPKPDIKNTRHNLSASNRITATPGSSFGTTVKADTGTTGTTQICVFCHTPHGAKSGTTTFVAPLWNRTLSPDTTYTQFYNSTSLDASPKPGSAGVGTGSKLCLSCHDGTVAIGTVGVLNNEGRETVPITMLGISTDGKMPPGKGENTGFTRRIGTNLSNDHPISFTYNKALADADGELYEPGTSLDVNGKIAVAGRVSGQPKPQFPLIVPVGSTDSPAVQRLSGQMECITCHDPHLKTDAVDQITGRPINNKFLRGNRYQLVSPTPSTTNNYDPAKDIICLACHNKPTWATSTHSNMLATDERYKDSAADLRDFPRDISTWQAACANCHDMHTVPGARRLLREGINSPFNPKVGNHTDPDGKLASVEQVCFQCHSPSGERILVTESPDEVPDIKTAFGYKVHMPIVTAEQGLVPGGNNDTEVHNIGTQAGLPDAGGNDGEIGCGIPGRTCNEQRGKDFLEPRSLMGAGAGNLKNRHAECTDCHQPHRVTRTVLFNGDPTIPAEKGTHRHGGEQDVGGVPHNNLASGSQRGQFGVEPVYSSDSFYDEPSGFIEKRGPVNTNSSVTAVGEPTSGPYAVTNTYLTREYQVCAKCHSNYAFGPLVGSIANPTNIPPLGRTGGTPAGTNGMQFYTNIFREIQAPTEHQGERTLAMPTTTPSGAFNANRDPSPYTAPYPSYSYGAPGGRSSGNLYLYGTVNFETNNHRSWHPVMGPTGRTPAVRGGANADNWLAPWDSVGRQTMYCTDCHGSKTPAGFAQQAVDGEPEGPHGSDNIFMLKGWWDNCTGKVPTNGGCLDEETTTVAANQHLNPPVTRPADSLSTTDNDLCFKCHSPTVYRDGSLASRSGFSNSGYNNLHGHFGVPKVGRCMWCHVAIPHGWKNKAFLVNLNDVGPEATCRQEDADDAPAGYKCSETVGVGNPMPKGTQVRLPGGNGPDGTLDVVSRGTGYYGYWWSRPYSNPPYYRRAILKIRQFAISGQWAKGNCGSVGAPGTGDAGVNWMNSEGGEGCVGVP